MDMGDLIKMGASAFINSKLSGDNGSNLDSNLLGSALSGLLGGGNSNSTEGGLDIGSILSNITSSGDSNLGSIAKSWLGDGENESITAEQITSILGSDKISEFASQLGLSEEEATGGLADALPQVIDKASSGGSILDSIGGISGAIGLASKLFGR
ncbi:MAG TPA: DUF937 domain-containing protein [Thiotrichaceae bacterium]|nr:DUF937 domain-containing protein [Thiotrichaceae bacterium]